MKRSLTLIMLLLFYFSNQLYSQQNTISKELLLRCDDMGMSHSVNMAIKEVIELGIPFSTSVMFNCPWYLEAVDILRGNVHVSIGIHLTLNSEWKNYRWGPISGKGTVPSLVDSNGYFFPANISVIDLEVGRIIEE